MRTGITENGSSSHAAAARQRRGHTLVELVVACVVLALGVLALQRAMLVILVQSRDSHTRELATTAVAAQHERLANRACATVLSGSVEDRGLKLSWEGGAPIGTSARRTIERVSYRLSGGEREDSYAGAVRCR